MIKKRGSPISKGKVSMGAAPSSSDDDDDDKYHDLAPKPKLLVIVALIVVSLFAVVHYYSESSSSSATENLLLQQQQSDEKKSSLRRSAVAAVPPLLPPAIRDGTYSSLWEYYECSDYFDTVKRPKDHGPTWNAMRKTYTKVMKPEQSMVKRLLTEPTAIQVPYEIREIEEKGLGIFATANIKKGTVIDDLSRGGRVKFYSGLDFKRYLNELEAPKYTCLAIRCSAVESTTRQTDDPQKGAFISVDLDDSCFMNDEDVGPNVGGLHTTDCDSCDFALTDIQPGDELQCEYLSYVFEDGWKWFGMLSTDDDDEEESEEETEEKEET